MSSFRIMQLFWRKNLIIFLIQLILSAIYVKIFFPFILSTSIRRRKRFKISPAEKKKEAPIPSFFISTQHCHQSFMVNSIANLKYFLYFVGILYTYNKEKHKTR